MRSVNSPKLLTYLESNSQGEEAVNTLGYETLSELPLILTSTDMSDSLLRNLLRTLKLWEGEWAKSGKLEQALGTRDIL